MNQPLFRTITSADWKRSLARAKREINPLHAQIGRAALVAYLPMRSPMNRGAEDGPAKDADQHKDEKPAAHGPEASGAGGPVSPQTED